MNKIKYLRSFLRLAGACTLLALASCTPSTSPPSAPASPVPPPYVTALSVKQVMEWVIDPAADEVWESVAIIITDKGENQKAPKTDEDWAKVRAGAATLVESANLLMLPGRARGGADSTKWHAAAKRMSDAAQVALTAAEKKDVAALFDSGANIYNACSACHSAYRVGDDKPVAESVKALPNSGAATPATPDKQTK